MVFPFKCGVLVFLVAICSSCTSQNAETKSVDGLDISNDNKRILFAFSKGGQSGIYELDIESSKIKTIVQPDQNKFFINPRYSSDDKEMVFIEYDQNDSRRSILNLIDLNSNSVEELLNEKGIITDVIFSSYRNEIVFCKASEYTKSSPIGVKAPHAFELYSIDLANKKQKQLSELNVYGMYHLFEVDSNNFFIHISAGWDGGIFSFNRLEADTLKRINLMNNPRESVKSLFDSPIYSKQSKKLAFIAPYEIYMANTETLDAKLVFDNTGKGHINSITFTDDGKELLFTLNGDSSFYLMNLMTNNVRKITPQIR